MLFTLSSDINTNEFKLRNKHKAWCAHSSPLPPLTGFRKEPLGDAPAAMEVSWSPLEVVFAESLWVSPTVHLQKDEMEELLACMTPELLFQVKLAGS